MNSAQVFGQGIKVAETDKLNIDSIIARLLEGKRHQKIIFLKSTSKPNATETSIISYSNREIFPAMLI